MPKLQSSTVIISSILLLASSLGGLDYNLSSKYIVGRR